MKTSNILSENIKGEFTESTVKRNDIFTINPREIIVNWDENTRTNYGDEDFYGTKESIKQLGTVTLPIRLMKITDENGNKRYKLTHGFRRMKAILELIEEGVNIERVSFMLDKNEEEVLVNHIVLNGGKPLESVEAAETIKRLSNMMGTKDVQKIVDRLNGFLNYQKVYNLLNFSENAGTQLKEEVKAGTVKFTTAAKLATKASVVKQNEVIAKAKEIAKTNNGKAKVSAKDVEKVSDLKITQDSSSIEKLKRIINKTGVGLELLSILDRLDEKENILIDTLNLAKFEAEEVEA